MRARANTFPEAFSESLRKGGFPICDYGYSPEVPAGARVLIIHWPNEFFQACSGERYAFLSGLIATWMRERKARGLRVVWVAHNARPHDVAEPPTDLAQRFLGCLDGVVHLSEASRALVTSLYGVAPRHSLVTRHGHYRSCFATQPLPWPSVQQEVTLGCFGRIRPYKNIETLIKATGDASLDSVKVRIAGKSFDPAYSDTITALARERSDITYAPRPEFLPEPELEAEIDRCHGIVLPYRSILNSGAAILALSRNRLVLAPRMGSLPELQRDVGSRWLHIYEGELTAGDIQSFAGRLAAHTGDICDLRAYDWDVIGPGLCEFLDKVCYDG